MTRRPPPSRSCRRGWRGLFSAVPAANPLHCFAVTLYGPHASGTDLDADERAMLGRIAGQAAAVYAELESSALRERIVRLERDLAEARPKRGPRPKRST